MVHNHPMVARCFHGTSSLDTGKKQVREEPGLLLVTWLEAPWALMCRKHHFTSLHWVLLPRPEHHKTFTTGLTAGSEVPWDSLKAPVGFLAFCSRRRQARWACPSPQPRPLCLSSSSSAPPWGVLWDKGGSLAPRCIAFLEKRHNKIWAAVHTMMAIAVKAETSGNAYSKCNHPSPPNPCNFTSQTQTYPYILMTGINGPQTVFA